MKKFLFIFLSLISIFIPILSQTPIRRQVTNIELVDSADIKYYSKKNTWAAAGQVLGLNVGIWGFDRFIMKDDFSYISMNTIKKNLKKGFVWDNDQMSTNMFGHPYHGSLYFNSARARGFNYWQSGAFALGGSLTWELFFENEYPSINDIIATPMGGLVLGEVLYRSSDLILDDRTRGKERIGREVAGFLISPSRGLTRLINGDATRKRATSGRQFGIPEISIETSIGIRDMELKDNISDDAIGASLEVNIEYGDKFSDECSKPYDYFTLRGSVNMQKKQPLVGQLNIVGRLWVTDVIDNSKDFLSLGFYQHFDYYDSDTISNVSKRIPYKVCTPASAGIGLIHKSKRFNNWIFDSHTHFNIIMLGGTLSDHYRVKDRDYNLGSGFSWLMGTNITYRDRFSISGIYEAYKMYTWKGYPVDFDWDNLNEKEFNYQGDHSQTIFHIFSLRSQLKFYNQLYLTSVCNYYRRNTNYKYFKNVKSRTFEGKLMLTYKF